MATSTGLKAADLTERIQKEAKSFSLPQILRLLGFLHAKSPEEWRAFSDDHVAIRSWLSLAFPSTEVMDVTADDDFYTVVITDFGLYSTMGALPTLYTEELLEEARQDESVSRGFLDILDNHLAHLEYNASLHHRLERRTVEYESREAFHIQFCLMGQADPSLRDAGLPRAVLAEIFARRTRSAAQLAFFLDAVLGRNDVRIEQCVETWHPIQETQRCCLGVDCASLGNDAMLGSCLRDSTSRFRIHFDRVSQKDMSFFLPGRKGHEIVRHHLRRFLDSPLDYELTLHPEQVPPPACELGANTAVGFYVGSPEFFAPVRVFWKEPCL